MIEGYRQISRERERGKKGEKRRRKSKVPVKTKKRGNPAYSQPADSLHLWPLMTGHPAW